MTLIDDVTYTLTGDVDNFRIIRAAISPRIRLDPNGSDRAVSGFLATNPNATRFLVVENIGLNSIEFLANNTGSDPHNRFQTGAVLGGGATLQLFYEPAVQRWLVITGGSGGEGGGTDDHGELIGLEDDDHPQYAYLAGRAGGQILNGGSAASEDLRLVSTSHTTKGDIFIGLFTWPTADGLAGQVMTTNGSGVLSFTTPAEGVTDHGLLDGLDDDDHTHYARLAGRAGGQTLNGGTAASEDLHLISTAHATKGDIFIGLLTWPTADGSANQVMRTNGSGALSFVSITSLFDHGDLNGLSDDDHPQYILAEPSSTDNRLVRWDSTSGRAVQTSGVTLSDTEAMTGLASAAASSFYSVGGTPATAGAIRGNSSFTLQVRNAGNSANVPLVSWASDDVTFGDSTVDANIVGLTIDLNSIRWPLADGTTDQVMVTDGAGQLSFTTVTSLFDHGTLSGLSDDDHTQYILAEPSSTDNRLVRWDSTTGRAVQTSGVTLSDADAITGLASAAASSFYSVGGTPATAGHLRGNASFTLQARNAGNSANVPLVSWASDDVTFGDSGSDTDIVGLTIDINSLRWPAADGTSNQVMVTNGSGVLSFASATSLFDHGDLGGLSDDDHTQYTLAAGGSNDNRLVRWHGSTGRSIQNSGVTLSDSEAITGLSSATASGFFAVGSAPLSSFGSVRGGSSFSIVVRNTGDSGDASLVTWLSDDLIVGNPGYDLTVYGLTINLNDIFWPTADGTSNQVMVTNGSGQLSFATITSLFDHGNLGGLSDDDHPQYVLAEPSSTDNRLVRWDSTTGRAIQTSGVTLNDSEAMTGLASAAASSFFAVGSTVSTSGSIRGASDFTLRARDSGNTVNRTVLAFASDTPVLGDSAGTTSIQGTELDILAPTTDLNGNSIANVNDLQLRSDSPTIEFWDNNGGSDGKRWRLDTGSSGDNFRIIALDDGGGALDTVLRFDRSGATFERAIFPHAHVSTNRTDEAGVQTSNLGSSAVDLSLSATTTHLRLTSSSFNNALAGLTGGTQGRKVYATNVDTDQDIIRILNESSSASAVNRILTPDGADFAFAPGATIVLFYDGVSSRWRLITQDGSRWRMRGVQQTTGSSAVEFFSITMPTNFVYVVDVWVASRRAEGAAEPESSFAISHFEVAYRRYESGNAIAASDPGSGLDVDDDSRPRDISKQIEINQGQVRLVALASGTAISLNVDPASAVNWRHNWVVEILAVPMDFYV